MTLLSSPVRDAIAGVRNQLRVTNGWLELLSDALLESLLERDIHVQILVGNEAEVKADLFLFNQLLSLKRRGVEMRFADPQNAHPHILIDELLLLDGESGDQSGSPSGIVSFLETWEELWGAAAPFFPENDDIRLSFESSNHQIFAGEEVNLLWEVEHATQVELFGVGPVERLGSKGFKLADDSYFKLKASNKLQTVYGSLFIHVDKAATVNYDLGFQNKRSHDFTSLVSAENYPDVFGVARDMPMQFSWSVTNAEKVEILPWGITKAVGHHEFTVEDSMVIEIVTHGAMKNHRKKIHLQVFPQPLLKTELTQVKPELSGAVHQQLEESLDKILGEAATQGWFSQPDGLKQFKKKELKRFKELQREIKALGFADFYKKINPGKLNASARARLLEKYKEDGDVKAYLDSIKAYYDS